MRNVQSNIESLVPELNKKFSDAPAEDIVGYFLQAFKGRIALSSSLSIEDQTLTDIIVKTDKTARIFTLDTGRLFPETYQLIDKTNMTYGINLEVFFPNYEAVQQMVKEEGINLFYNSIESRHRCCQVRKLEPLKRAMKGLDVWICGLRKQQSVTRKNMQVVEWDDIHNLIKVNPLINWSEEDVEQYVKKHHVPYNKLQDKGFPSIGCQPCTRAIKPGEDINAIVGSLYIVGGSTIVGLLIALPVVFYMNVYLKPNSKFGYAARLAYDTLFGIPSIVYGSFAFTIMVWLGIRASLGGGILVTTLLIVPILIRSMDEVAKTIPQEILDSSYSLGATRIETIGVVLRQIAPAIATATLLSIGRAIGDCAGVMFTAGFSDHIPHGLNQQAATLPLSVFFQLSAPLEDVQNRAYAAAVVLTIIVLILSFGGRFIMSHFSKNKI